MRKRLGFDIEPPFFPTSPSDILDKPTPTEKKHFIDSCREAWMEKKNKDDPLTTANEILRSIYTPTLQEQLEDSMTFLQAMPKRPKKPWHKRLVRRFRNHIYDYNVGLAERMMPYHDCL